ncbi:protein kinase domain-containing protein [Nonomuraea africana]|uniref:non-specific serine/threonine protein kinase n=1 Tax=Nonomuraea africana TaxID=46171 RepID=A0ABR9KG34_9ACTN|nr:protein kinase [Nonomuraea africana]MBE1560971.1 putative Ser/Thr protein kinase [Nonomuraea africana]
MTASFIGPYRVVRPLGEGGQGVVYLATAPDGRPVAVKTLREGFAGDDRFAKEIAAARRVEPFCIAQVLDASLGGRPYIVTEYVEGPSLQEAGRHLGADLQRLAISTATALAAIHRAGVVHRDFKPANVLLGRDGPRVIDFGIARAADSALTVTSSVVGTPSYMAPEQLAGEEVGPATDVFAWAGVMVFAATGTPPFGRGSLPEVIRRVQYGEPHLDAVPDALRPIVARCLDKEPARRPSMQDVLFELIGGQTLPRSAPARRRPRPALVAGGAALAVTCVAAAAWGAASFWDGGAGTAAVPLPSVEQTGKIEQTGKTSQTRKTPQTGKTPQPGKTSQAGQTESERLAGKTRRPEPTRSPTPTMKPAPTRAVTSPASKPTASPTTKRPTSGGGVSSATLRYEGIRLGDCWRYDLNIFADVKASGTFSYRWLVNGQNMGRHEARSGDKVVLPSITWKQAGSYRVVFEVITPSAVRRGVTVDICDFDEGW